MNEIDFKELNNLLNESFTPHTPINVPDFLAGRQDIINKVRDAVRTPGLHVILYGQRGTGKTSIARVIANTLQENTTNGRRVFLVSCNSNDNYSLIWQNVARSILLAERQLGFVQQNIALVSGRLNLESPINEPNSAKLFIESLPNTSLIIIDEFDRVQQNGETQKLLADTIKLFSDFNVSSTIIVVGVAESINELFAQHQSIARNTAQIKVEPMNVTELAEIIQKGYSHAKMTFEENLDKKIAMLSQGYPHYTHLLGLWAGRQCIQNRRTNVNLNDLKEAIPKAIENAAGGLLNEYEKAVTSSQKYTLFKDVLLACALAPKDSLGKFSMTDIKEPLYKITGKTYEPGAYQSHLAKFCEQARGPVLKKTGTPRNFKWQFLNPQLIAFIAIKGMNDKRIDFEN